MRKYVLIFLILLTNHALSNELKPFITDYCTMFVDGTPTNPNLWKHCCIEHDIHYWYGGSLKDQDITDLKLKSCVEAAAGTYWADIIYLGVRAGHYSPVKNVHKWSWGWEQQRKKIEISDKEKLYVIEEIRKLPLDTEQLNRYIKNNF